MNKSVSYYISELLFSNDCVIIPEFGGFVSNRKSAQLNKYTGKLTPPSKKILFNTNLKTNDGLLISHIATKECISRETATLNISQFASETNSKLNLSKVLRLDKIGLFTVGKEGNIIFLQDSTINYSLDTFGMEPTYKKSVVRKIEAKKEVKETLHKISARNPQLLLRAAAVIIPLVALSYLSISQEERINNVYSHMATFTPFTSAEKIENIIEIYNEKSSDIKVESSPIAEIIKKDLPEINLQKRYYIIAGAFAEQKNADKMLRKLKRWSYNSEIVKGKNLLRVSYNSFYNRDDAVLALNKIKQENPQAWLFKK